MTRRGLLSALGLLPAVGVASLIGPESSASPDRCVPDKLVKTQYVRADLSLSDAPIPGAGRVYTFRDAAGSTSTQLSTPEGFQPTRASAAVLDFYGFPPRPTDPAGRAQWKKDYSGRWQPSEPGMCTEVTRN